MIIIKVLKKGKEINKAAWLIEKTSYKKRSPKRGLLKNLLAKRLNAIVTRQNDECFRFGRENTENGFQTFSRGYKKNWRSHDKEEDSTEATKKENVRRTDNGEGEDAAYFEHS